MFPRLRVRTLTTAGLLLLSIFWVAITFLPLLYSLAFPPRDIQQIVTALEGRRSTLSEPASAIVGQTMATLGMLRRALQVAYYSGISATFRVGASHTDKKTQVAYIAWFDKTPKPILLVIERSEIDGVPDAYSLDEVEPTSLVRAYVLPLAVFSFALFLVLRKRRHSSKESRDAPLP